MPVSSNAKIQIETGQTVSGATYSAMTDSGDHQVYTVSGGTLWSGKSGFAPSIRPNGMVSGRNVLSTHASDDKVTIAAFTAYVKGTLYEVSATSGTITRAGTAAKAQVHSITLASDGASIAVVEGVLSDTTAFSSTRNASGGPPYIPADSVELGQVRVTASTAAVIASTEIFQVVGTHTERYDYPSWAINNIGDGVAATESAKTNAYIEFDSTHPLIHTAAATKKTYVQYYTPVFSDVSRAMDFVPVEESYSVSSTQYYRGTVASSSSSIGQGSFVAMLNDGITDSLVYNKGQILTVKFFQDADKTPYVLSQGVLGLTRSFPVADQIQASCTISAEQSSAEFTS